MFVLFIILKLRNGGDRYGEDWSQKCTIGVRVSGVFSSYLCYRVESRAVLGCVLPLCAILQEKPNLKGFIHFYFYIQMLYISIISCSNVQLV